MANKHSPKKGSAHFGTTEHYHFEIEPMKILKYQLQGQNLLNTETGKSYVLTNGEFQEVSLMLSFYYLILSKMLVVDDWLYITSGFNRYLETFEYG